MLPKDWSSSRVFSSVTVTVSLRVELIFLYWNDLRCWFNSRFVRIASIAYCALIRFLNRVLTFVNHSFRRETRHIDSVLLVLTSNLISNASSWASNICQYCRFHSLYFALEKCFLFGISRKKKIYYPANFLLSTLQKYSQLENENIWSNSQHTLLIFII